MSIFTQDSAKEIFYETVTRALIQEKIEGRELTSTELEEFYIQYRTEYLILPTRVSAWVIYMIMFMIPWVAIFGGAFIYATVNTIDGMLKPK